MTERTLTQISGCTRRVFQTSLCSLIFSAAFGENANCIEGSSDDSTNALFERSGNDDFDAALIVELRRIVRTFEINPGFKYKNVMNAYSTSTTIVEGTEGTVILGLPLMRELMQQEDGGASVAGVCAHECAHVYQQKAGLTERLTSSRDHSVMRFELHADFMAGYYFGRRRELVSDKIEIFAVTAYAMGDYQFRDRVHHGTPTQRSAAVKTGYQVAVDGAYLAKAAESGMAFVANF